MPKNATPVILVKQDHRADKAGRHTDWRLVVGDKAYSWATKKPDPKKGEKLILWEQPVHDARYALSQKITIPKGQYGAGVTELVYAQKGEASMEKDQIHVNLNNGDGYFLKKVPNYGDKAWLLVKTASQIEVSEDEELAKLIRALLEMRPIRRASATKAYLALADRGLLTQEALRNINQESLQRHLKQNGYGRFDIKTSGILKELAQEDYPIALPRKHVGPRTLQRYLELKTHAS